MNYTKKDKDKAKDIFTTGITGKTEKKKRFISYLRVSALICGKDKEGWSL